MARKKITSLLGKDPEYSKEFSDTPSIAAPTPAKKPQAAPKPKTASIAETKAPPAATAKQKPKPPVKKPAAAPAPKAMAVPKPTAQAEGAPTRAVHVRASPKSIHKAGLDALQKAGLPISDVVRLAGKRAIEKFELKNDYLAPQEAERLPSDMSFRTMKTLDAETLDTLRDQADPLRLRSDAAVIQGQLEPVFWQELDALIAELRKQYS